MLATKFHYAVQLRTSSKPTPNRFGASSEPASVMEFGTNQLQTSSEQASVMEFGYNSVLMSGELVALCRLSDIRLRNWLTIATSCLVGVVRWGCGVRGRSVSGYRFCQGWRRSKVSQCCVNRKKFISNRQRLHYQNDIQRHAFTDVDIPLRLLNFIVCEHV